MESYRKCEWEPRGIGSMETNTKALTNRDLHTAAAGLNYELVKKILETAVVDIHNTDSIGQGKTTGLRPGHLYQHFYISQVQMKHQNHKG